MAKKQTLKQALHLARTGESRSLARAAHALHGAPEGGWPETQQALQSIAEDLPNREDRAYTIREFIAAAYELPHNDHAAERYRSRIAD